MCVAAGSRSSPSGGVVRSDDQAAPRRPARALPATRPHRPTQAAPVSCPVPPPGPDRRGPTRQGSCWRPPSVPSVSSVRRLRALAPGGRRRLASGSAVPGHDVSSTINSTLISISAKRALVVSSIPAAVSAASTRPSLVAHQSSVRTELTPTPPWRARRWNPRSPGSAAVDQVRGRRRHQ